MKKMLLFLLTLVFVQNNLAQNGGYALKFDGTDDYATKSAAVFSGTTNRTFEAWVYVDNDASGPMYLLSQRESGDWGISGAYVLQINSDVAVDFWDYYQDIYGYIMN